MEHAGKQVKSLMIENVARLLRTDLSRVNVKALFASMGSSRRIGCPAAKSGAQFLPVGWRHAQMAGPKRPDPNGHQRPAADGPVLLAKGEGRCAAGDQARTHEKVDSVGECRALECHVVLTLEREPTTATALSPIEV